MIDAFAKFPQYCEYVSNFWLHEPLNAITNFAFFIGAYYLYKFVKRNDHDMRLGVLLVCLMIILGLGSLAWHSYRSAPTLLMDEVPIYIFVIFSFVFLVHTLTRSYKITFFISFFTALIYYVVFAYISVLNIFQGSLKYAFVALLFLVLNIQIVRKFGRKCSFVLPVGILIVAIIFRTLDLYICSVFPIGTHFVWHVAVALAVYFGSVAMLRLSSTKQF